MTDEAPKVEVGRGVDELRLAILGIVLTVALGSAAIGLAASSWGGVVGGVGSVALVIAVLKVRGLRHEVMHFANWLLSG